MSYELRVFPSYQHARDAGFGGPHGKNPNLPFAIAWWPALGLECVRGLTLSRVVITQPMTLSVHERSDLKSQLRHPPFEWEEGWF